MKPLFAILLFAISLLAGCTKPTKRIAVIHSYEESFPLYTEYNQLIVKNFTRNGIHPDIKFFYLDCENFNEQGEIQQISAFLDSIADWNPDIILTNDDQATYSSLMTRHELMKTRPVVFSGVNYPNWELIKEYPNVTGFHDKIDILKNIEVAKELSHTIKTFTLLDSTFIDQKIRADILEQFEGTDIISSLNIPPFSTQIHDIKDKTFLNILSARGYIKSNNNMRINTNFLWGLSKFNHQTAYLQLKYDFTTVTIANFYMTNRYSAIYEMFGCGYNFRAGYMTTLPTQVKEAVDLATQLLNGAVPQTFPIRESAKNYVADWEVLKKIGFKRVEIPQKYQLINMPFNERHPVVWYAIIIITIIVLVILFCWLTYLYLNELKMRRQVLCDLEEERESLALAIEGGNTFAWTIEHDMLQFKNTFGESALSKNILSEEEFTTFIHPEYRDKFHKHWQDIQQKGTHHLELLCNFNTSDYQWWEFRSSTMTRKSGQHKTTGLILNINEYKKREQELIVARELAEKAELKQSFLANMSHEIRTPLNAIVGFSNILTSDPNLEEEDKKVFIDTINTNSELLLKLINDILEISRIESGNLSFKFQKYSVNTLINEIYNTYRIIMPPHLQFLKETGEEQLYIYVDKNRLTQVLTNLLNNAEKFTSKGYIKLGYKYFPESEQVHIFVEDSGKGIPRSEQKMIFNRFYKHDEFAQGTGLGLSICQVIVEKLNGQIELWSEPGIGSRFTIILSILPQYPSIRP